jgi:hypothetical protein
MSKNGVMEYWNNGVMGKFVVSAFHFVVDPILQHSTTPILQLGER